MRFRKRAGGDAPENHGGTSDLKKPRVGRRAAKILLVILGNALCALAVAAFIAPSGFIMGGATGIGLLLSELFGIPTGAAVGVINIGLFAAGAWFLGRSFALTTLLSTVLYPLFLTLFQNAGDISGPTDSPVLCMIYGGCLVGAGIGIVLRQGASTGGTDIPPLILHKKFGLSVSVCLNIIDFAILTLQLASADMEQILYGIVTVFLYSAVLGRVLTLGKNQTQVKIISESYREINQAIQDRLQRGVTLLPGEGGHSGETRRVLFSVVSNRELVRLKDLVMEIDPRAFLIINSVSEVRGMGFTIEKPELT